MSHIKISNGRLIDPTSELDKIADLYIANNIIIGIDHEPDGFQVDQEINASGHLVCPGFIDLNCHLREPGHTYKADINSETKAAAASGFTSLCLPPDTQPVIDSTAVTELVKERAERANFSQIYPIGALTNQLQGKELSSMFGLKQAGCIAVSNAGQPIQNLLILHRAMEYAASHDLLVIYQPINHALADNGCAHQGAFATRYGLPGIPEAAETIALSQCLELVQQNQCRVHFSQISCARSVTLIQQAKTNGLPVSADVAMHQLHLCEDDMIPFDSTYHVNPPLRTKQDRTILRYAVKEGIIDAICSAHQPHDLDAKLGAFPETEAGISTLETILPLLLNLVNQNILSLQQGIQALTSNPAAIANLPGGSLQIGALADICIFKPDQSWMINKDNWHSRGKNSPYMEHTMTGKVTYTLQSGNLIFQTSN